MANQCSDPVSQSLNYIFMNHHHPGKYCQSPGLYYQSQCHQWSLIAELVWWNRVVWLRCVVMVHTDSLVSFLLARLEGGGWTHHSILIFVNTYLVMMSSNNRDRPITTTLFHHWFVMRNMEQHFYNLTHNSHSLMWLQVTLFVCIKCNSQHKLYQAANINSSLAQKTHVYVILRSFD